MTTLENIDIVVERERDAAVDALCDSQPFQLVEPFVYDKNTWFADCANYMVGTVEQMDDVRMWLRDALYWIEDGSHTTEGDKVRAARCLSIIANNIGWQIIKAALDSPLSQQTLGERTP